MRVVTVTELACIPRNHCLAVGGKHVEASHFRLMINCAEICQASTNFMLSGSVFHQKVCAVCAEICDACAKSCRKMAATTLKLN